MATLLKREELLQALAALQEALQGLPPLNPPHPLGMKVFAEKNEAAAWVVSMLLPTSSCGKWPWW